MISHKCKKCKSDRTIFTRGVCGSCFKKMLEDVEDGITTWEQLESKGWILSALEIAEAKKAAQMQRSAAANP